MLVIFLLDNREYLTVAPEKLQIRQINPGQSSLGIEVSIPLTDLTDEQKASGDWVQERTGFRPLINYQMDISLPSAPTPDIPEVPPLPASSHKKAKAKVKA